MSLISYQDKTNSFNYVYDIPKYDYSYIVTTQHIPLCPPVILDMRDEVEKKTIKYFSI